MRRLAVLAVACACHGSQAPLYPAGTDRDDGNGLLAQASAQILTGDETDIAEGLDDLEPPHRHTYGGDAYGGGAYGGTAYGGYVVPSWNVQAPNRTPKYNQLPSLNGAIEGTVALRATKIASACGVVETPPVAVVYIEKVTVGRTISSEGRPASVGGTIVKRGCTLAPVVQIVTPLPAALAVHGDAKPARLRVASKIYDLEAGGRVALQLEPGVTRVDAENGSLGAAWVLALDTPYVAMTDAQGRFRLDELAAGTYEVTIWQPPSARASAGVLSYGEPTVTKRTVRVELGHPARLDVR